MVAFIPGNLDEEESLQQERTEPRQSTEMRSWREALGHFWRHSPTILLYLRMYDNAKQIEGCGTYVDSKMTQRPEKQIVVGRTLVDIRSPRCQLFGWTWILWLNLATRKVERTATQQMSIDRLCTVNDSRQLAWLSRVKIGRELESILLWGKETGENGHNVYVAWGMFRKRSGRANLTAIRVSANRRPWCRHWRASGRQVAVRSRDGGVSVRKGRRVVLVLEIGCRW